MCPMSHTGDAPARVTPLAGQPATPAMLVDVSRLITAYYSELSDASVPAQRVAFGTSGHRGWAFDSSFNEWHVLAIAQAICDYRKQRVSMVRCSSASTPTSFPHRRFPVRSKCWRPTAWAS